jgi:anionic cell wall polymer biosynthesis LytR-Cps2A-Psr (LCP) family protein
LAPALLVGLVVLLVVEIVVLWVHTARSLEPTSVPSLAEVPSGASDQRGGETLVVVTDTDGDAQRVISLSVVQSHPDRPRPTVLVLPRRLKVPAPGHGDLLLAAVLGRGGPELLVRTVQDYSGLDIEHIAVIDARGVADMAAEQGGVDLCAIQSSPDCKSSGADAVHALLTEANDVDETAVVRQQFAVIRAVVAKSAGRLNILLHPFRSFRTASAAGQALLTDVDLGGRSAVGHASRLTSHDTNTVDFITLPGFRDPGGGTVETFVEQAEGVLQAMRDGTEIPEEAFNPPTDLAPSEVTVIVLNGTGIDGLANQVANRLTSAGFDVIEVGNAASFNLDETAIDFGPGLRRFADLALVHVPGATLREGDQPFFRQGQDVDLIITIGQDFEGARQPSESESPTAADR